MRALFGKGKCAVCQSATDLEVIERQAIGDVKVEGISICQVSQMIEKSPRIYPKLTGRETQACITDQPASTDWKVWVRSLHVAWRQIVQQHPSASLHDSAPVNTQGLCACRY